MSNSSIQFIKCYSNNILIAVRVATDGELSFRTKYPITDSQLADYKKTRYGKRIKNKINIGLSV